MPVSLFDRSVDGSNQRSSRRNEPLSEAGSRNVVIIDQSKGQTLTVNSGYRHLHRRLKSSWRIEINTAELNDDISNDCRVLIIAAPRAKFSHHEFETIRRFVQNGGSLLCMMGEGGEITHNTNLNFLLEEYGIMVNNDSVIRTIFYKYFHPKEALISNGVLNRAVGLAAGKTMAGGASSLDDDETFAQSLTFVYPHGATLNVNRNGTALLSTGSVCYPTNRPALAVHNKEGGGKIAVIGSEHMFSDAYFDKEENSKIFDVIMQYLTDDEFKLNSIDADDPDISDFHTIPDHLTMSNQLKCCLQEGEGELATRDLTKLFDSSLFSMDLALLPKHLNVKHEPLAVIGPQFEVPLPPLEPAVFAPNFREPPPPHLELFDLDDVFSSQIVRLAQITNKCEEEDLKYFVEQASDIYGIRSSLPADKRSSGKHMLEYVMHQVVEFKKLNQDDDGMEGDYHEYDADHAQFDDEDFMDEQEFSDVEIN